MVAHPRDIQGWVWIFSQPKMLLVRQPLSKPIKLMWSGDQKGEGGLWNEKWKKDLTLDFHFSNLTVY